MTNEADPGEPDPMEERVAILERHYHQALDQATKLFQQSHNALTRLLTVFTVIFALGAGAIGLQTYATWDRFREALQREQAVSLRQLQLLPYRARLDSGKRKLKSASEEQRDGARNDDLLATLNSAPPALLYDIALEFKQVIPELTIPTEPKDFRDSYRAVVWIYVILLESGVDEVVHDVRRIAPHPDALRSWASQVEPKVDPERRQEFRHSVDRLIRGLRERPL
jgi:hypothetical protein